MRVILILAACALVLWVVTGCATPNPGPCPPIRQYDEAFNQRLAGELEQLPPDAATIQAIEELIVLRDQLKQCQ